MNGLRYYRLPFLMDLKAKEAIISELGYRKAPVSTDNDDW